MKAYTKITLWYLGFGLTWIILSDRIFEGIAESIEHLSRIQTVKGWLYVGISSILIFYISRKAFKDVVKKEREKQSVFKRTIQGVYHIFLNYLNQMQVVILEAEVSKDFNQEILELSKDCTEEAQQALGKLELLDDITEESITRAVYGPDIRMPLVK